MSSFIDQNLRSIDARENFFSLEAEVLDGVDASINDTLKVSHSKQVHVANKTLRNFNEDCLDLCRVHDSSFDGLVLEPHGKNGITVKGASTNISIRALFTSHGSECDVELGQFDNYWYPGRPPTTGIDLALTSNAKDRPILVRVWDADKINISVPAEQGALQVKRYPKWVWFPYFLFRYTWLRAENIVRKGRGLTPIKTS